MATQPVEALSTLPIAVPDEQVQIVEKKQSGLLARAIALVVNSPESEKLAWDIVNGIGELKKNIVEDFAESKSAAHKAWKAICSQEAGHLDSLKEPDAIVRGKLGVWQTEKQRIQQEQERIAREAAETERKRLQAIADEAARVEQERLRKEAEDRKIREALEAEAAGKKDVADAIMNTPVIVPMVAPAPVVIIAPAVVPSIAAQKVEGSGAMVEKWHFRITMDGMIPREYMSINESALQKVVDALKKNTKIPGIEVYPTFEARRAGKR